MLTVNLQRKGDVVEIEANGVIIAVKLVRDGQGKTRLGIDTSSEVVVKFPAKEKSNT